MFDDLKHLLRHHSRIALRYYEAVDVVETFTYEKIHADSLEVFKGIEAILAKEGRHCNDLSCYNIAVLFSTHSPALLPAIIGIANSHNASYFIHPADSLNSILRRMEQINTNAVLCDVNNFEKFKSLDEDHQIVTQCSLSLSNRNCVLFQLASFKLESKKIPKNQLNNSMTSSEVLFYAMTSGSCGEMKPIGVTYKCFMPNVHALGKLYSINKNDVIFVSSPPTFDPFMVDICLALKYGASLIMVSNKLRLSPQHLLNILFPIEKSHQPQCAATILQTTPSLFSRWTCDEIKNRIFSNHSRLRILALGGEPFPSTHEIAKWRNWHECDNTKRIFNLYGLTEMSCWASIYEITKDDVLLVRKIPIGEPLDDRTTFDVDANGELLIKSKKRKCFQRTLSDQQVLDDNYEFILHTNDIMEFADEFRMVFKSRTNSMIKFLGQKLDLEKIETIAKNTDGIKNACCVHDEERKMIVLFVILISSCESDFGVIQLQILQSLARSAITVHIECCQVNKFPLSAHGKISKADLLKLHVNKADGNLSETTVSKIFLTILNRMLCTNIDTIEPTKQFESTEKRQKCDFDLSFLDLGGSSVKAIQLLNEMQEITQKFIPFALPMLLSQKTSIKEIVNQLNEQNHSIQLNDDTSDSLKISKIDHHHIHWTIDMSKCIDASPTICRLSNDSIIVSIGSHSRLLYNVLVTNGEILSKLSLPDRIESQVTQLSDFGIVGCYDGFLYCFDFRSGAIQWKFNSNGMIKCRALVMDSMIIFGNYNSANNLWCVNKDSGELISCLRIGTKSIYANPVELDKKDFIACTLDGTIACVRATSSTEMKTMWKRELNDPIFSTPSIMRDGKSLKTFIIVATVCGSIHGLDSDGNQVWIHQINGNIFSSFESFRDADDSVNIVVGSHDRFLYCLTLDKEISSCNERWRHKFDAPIRATPKLITFRGQNYFVSCSVDGMISVNCAKTGRSLKELKIDGEIFSSPTAYEKRLFIGSRNNSLYCIDLAVMLYEGS